MKSNFCITKIARDIVAYVDDLRASGHLIERTWPIARQQIVSRLQYFGIQDAPCKRRPSVRVAGTWAGLTFTTTANDVHQSVAQSKWDKAKSQIAELLRMLEESIDDLIQFQILLQWIPQPRTMRMESVHEPTPKELLPSLPLLFKTHASPPPFFSRHSQLLSLRPWPSPFGTSS
jgi:hypothetical protein